VDIFTHTNTIRNHDHPVASLFTNTPIPHNKPHNKLKTPRWPSTTFVNTLLHTNFHIKSQNSRQHASRGNSENAFHKANYCSSSSQTLAASSLERMAQKSYATLG
jgi:hypothetical protein